jgi:hypothetical protein
MIFQASVSCSFLADLDAFRARPNLTTAVDEFDANATGSLATIFLAASH